MVHRTFNNYKYFRTYIGGSKKREKEIFKKVQGQNEDCSDCNWIEYRRIFIEYYNDVTNVVLSWKILFKNLSIVLAIISLFLLLINIYLFVVAIIASLLSHILFLFFKRKLRNDSMQYEDAIDIIVDAINEQTGLNLSKD